MSMSTRTLVYILVLCLIAILLLLARGFNASWGTTTTDRYFSLNDVRGMEVVHAGKPYTLNFEQQAAVVEILNRAITVGRIRNEALDPPGFQKLIIYPFGQPIIELEPLDIVSGNLIFSAPALQRSGYLQDTSQGELLHLLSRSYDN